MRNNNKDNSIGLIEGRYIGINIIDFNNDIILEVATTST